MMGSQGDEQFFELAIQTVLHNNKHRLRQPLDSGEGDLFLQDMSREIMRKAQTFKTIADAAVRELESGSGALRWEGAR